MDAIPGIIIVESADLMRACLTSLVARLRGLAILGSTGDFNQARLAIAALRPRLVLVGLSRQASAALDFIGEVKRAHPDLRILALTFTNRDENLEACFQAGADAYVLNAANHVEIAAAIRSAIDGASYHNANRRTVVFAKDRRDSPSIRGVDASARLTPRQHEVLRLVATAHTNKAIANRLDLSISTVEKHRASIFRTLGLQNMAEATAYAIERGWAPLTRRASTFEAGA